MFSGQNTQGQKISSGSTTWWRDIFPTVWAVGFGVVVTGAWLGWWGHSEPLGLKIFLGGAWAGTSVLMALFGRTLFDVWLAEDRLIVWGKGQRSVIRLEDITGFSETRAQKVKTIQIKLRPGLPIGSSIRFLPPLKLQTPFSEHPLIREIKDQKERLAGKSNSGQLAP